ncbi:hypothetical protein STEG23_031608, partial [Scotinomys teguina]
SRLLSDGTILQRTEQETTQGSSLFGRFQEILRTGTIPPLSSRARWFVPAPFKGTVGRTERSELLRPRPWELEEPR